MSLQERIPRPVELGQSAPKFRLQDTDGNWVDSKTISNANRSHLLVFFRGEWCPVSKKELAGLARDYSRFKELNSEIVAISSMSPDKSAVLKRKLSLPFPILSDPGFEAIDLYGVRVMKSQIKDDEKHSSNPAISATYIKYIKRIETYAGPSVFIVDPAGQISYKFFGRDEATDFPENQTLLAKLNAASARR